MRMCDYRLERYIILFKSSSYNIIIVFIFLFVSFAVSHLPPRRNPKCINFSASLTFASGRTYTYYIVYRMVNLSRDRLVQSDPTINLSSDKRVESAATMIAIIYTYRSTEYTSIMCIVRVPEL